MKTQKLAAALCASVLSFGLFGCSGSPDAAQDPASAQAVQAESGADAGTTDASPADAEPAGQEEPDEPELAQDEEPAGVEPAGESAEPAKPAEQEEGREMNRFYLHVNGQTLPVAAARNSSSDALIALLAEGDVAVDAHDYGSFEKVGSLPQSLPTNDEQITTEPGDVILYQGNQITVYYGTNSWSLTRLGKVEGTSAEELKQILGDGNVEIRLSLE
ncbi:cyclophilin-like fold protein [Xiamenia xianingshaonis]|nr:cyclophilin-like fold protein [Xiamenia xianingshaonis]